MRFGAALIVIGAIVMMAAPVPWSFGGALTAIAGVGWYLAACLESNRQRDRNGRIDNPGRFR